MSVILKIEEEKSNWTTLTHYLMVPSDQWYLSFLDKYRRTIRLLLEATGLYNDVTQRILQTTPEGCLVPTLEDFIWDQHKMIDEELRTIAKSNSKEEELSEETLTKVKEYINLDKRLSVASESLSKLSLVDELRKESEVSEVEINNIITRRIDVPRRIKDVYKTYYFLLNIPRDGVDD